MGFRDTTESTTEAAHNVLKYLKLGIAELLHQIEGEDFWQITINPKSDKALVREFMKQVYLEIHWYQPDVIEATVSVIGQFPRALDATRIRTMLIHQAEEWDHGQMAFRDHVNLGGDPETARNSFMSPTAFNTAAFWRMLVQKRTPFAYLGGLYLFEGLTPIVTARVKDSLSGNGIPSNALEYIEFHSTEDVRHTKIVDHLVVEVLRMFPHAAESVRFGFDAFRQVYPLPGWRAAFRRAATLLETQTASST